MKLSKAGLLCVFSVAIASAASTYRVTVAQKALLGSTELKPGDYKIEVDGDKAVLKVGGKPVETPVKVETGNQKFSDTLIDTDSQNRIKTIRIKGTNATLVFSN